MSKAQIQGFENNPLRHSSQAIWQPQPYPVNHRAAVLLNKCVELGKYFYKITSVAAMCLQTLSSSGWRNGLAFWSTRDCRAVVERVRGKPFTNSSEVAASSSDEMSSGAEFSRLIGSWGDGDFRVNTGLSLGLFPMIKINPIQVSCKILTYFHQLPHVDNIIWNLCSFLDSPWQHYQSFIHL